MGKATDSVNKDCFVVKLTVIFQQEGLYGRMAIEEGGREFLRQGDKIILDVTTKSYQM